MKKQHLLFLLLVVLITTTVSSQIPARKGWWKFDDESNLMKATIGQNLAPYGTGAHIAAFGPVEGNGAIVDMPGQGLIMNHGIAANGGGLRVNVYSMQFDVKAIGTEPGYYSFFQTGASNSGDGDLFFKWGTGGTGVLGLGVLGWSTNTVEPEVWYRVVVTSSGTTYKVFVNGELWIEKTGIEIDSRHALQIEELPHIFVDDDGEEGEIHCSELAVWDVELTPEQVAELGNANNGEIAVTGIRPINASDSGMLGQNFPNPFAGHTVFPYTIRESGNVEFKVLDMTGKLLQVISENNKTPGDYTLNLNAENLANGIYYLQMISNNQLSVRKMVVSK